MRTGPVRAFTLVELIVVMAVVALLIAMLLPALKKAKEAAEGVRCLSNLRQLGMGFQMYTMDRDRYLPYAIVVPAPATTWATQLQPYIPTKERWGFNNQIFGSVYSCATARSLAPELKGSGYRAAYAAVSARHEGLRKYNPPSDPARNRRLDDILQPSISLVLADVRAGVSDMTHNNINATLDQTGSWPQRALHARSVGSLYVDGRALLVNESLPPGPLALKW